MPLEKPFSISSYQNLLHEAAKYFREKPERNVFSIGGRGYYENPLSDLLTFFMDPNEEHGLGPLVLNSFLACVKDAAKKQKIREEIDNFKLEDPPSREVKARNNKRIDILLNGYRTVIVIEAKVYHSAFNPFPDYEDFVCHDLKYKDKKPVFVILSPKKPESSADENKWININHKDLIKHLEANLGTALVESFSKWVVILRELILTIKELGGEYMMSEEEVNFVARNYEQINKLIQLRETYINHIHKEGIKRIPGANEDDVREESWGKEGTAIRFYSKIYWHHESNHESNITILLRNEGTFRIQFYTPDCITESQMQSAQEYFRNFTNDSKIDRNKLFMFTKTPDYDKLDEVFKAFEKLVSLLNSYYKKQNINPR